MIIFTSYFHYCHVERSLAANLYWENKVLTNLHHPKVGWSAENKGRTCRRKVFEDFGGFSVKMVEMNRQQRESFALRSLALHKTDKAPLDWCHLRFVPLIQPYFNDSG